MIQYKDNFDDLFVFTIILIFIVYFLLVVFDGTHFGEKNLLGWLGAVFLATILFMALVLVKNSLSKYIIPYIIMVTIVTIILSIYEIRSLKTISRRQITGLAVILIATGLMLGVTFYPFKEKYIVIDGYSFSIAARKQYNTIRVLRNTILFQILVHHFITIKRCTKYT